MKHKTRKLLIKQSDIVNTIKSDITIGHFYLIKKDTEIVEYAIVRSVSMVVRPRRTLLRLILDLIIVLQIKMLRIIN